MNFQDLIASKKLGESIDADSLREAVDEYCAGGVPDYQMSAFMMAVCWRGLDIDETVALTLAMTRSGDVYRFDDLPAPSVDKHSTGGVGDKISLILAPLAAACGCIVPMVSGRGLGHTGGTLDKLESIPGLRTDLGYPEFRGALECNGFAMAGQTETFVPADRLLYALRDVTCTVDAPGLITASILSKKIAEGADALILDVKAGSGSIMGDLDRARGLAERLIDVAGSAGLRTTALVTDMDRPLGRTVGNALEVAESIDVLRGEGPDRVRGLTLELVAEMLVVGGIDRDREAARRRAVRHLDAGDALERFRRMVELQGGDPAAIDDPARLPRATSTTEVSSRRDGFVARIDARRVADAALHAGAGRQTKESRIDPGAGIVLHIQPGARVSRGETWATLHHGDDIDHTAARRALEAALEVADTAPEPKPLVIERIP